MEHRKFEFDQSGRTVSTEVTTVSSPHHIELCPADTGTKDRLVVQDVIKEIAMSAPIDLSTVRRNDDDNHDDDTHRDNDDINGLDCVAIDWIRWIGLRGGNGTAIVQGRCVERGRSIVA